jgi:glutathione synthase/RimK-type ligase-like ATP-grasp enzyme
VLNGSDRFLLEVESGRAHFTLDEQRFAATDLVAAWWRKPQWIDLDTEDRARQLSLMLEFERLHLAVASVIPDSAWLNQPSHMNIAGRRLRQLQVAHKCGFETPRTVVTNDWRDVPSGSDVIFKTFRGSLVTREDQMVVFTTRLGEAEIDELAGRAFPYPGFFQPFVSKRCEWRVYVVNDQVLPYRVAPMVGAAPDDWRRGQMEGRVTFEADLLPGEFEERCREVVSQLGLGFAAIDLVERPDGGLVFLEANPNGQYAWLERDGCAPISEAIAGALDRIASGRETGTALGSQQR